MACTAVENQERNSQNTILLEESSINKKFSEVIALIGYGPSQQERVSRSFSLEKKIRTIVSLQKFSEKKDALASYMASLRHKPTLVTLYFLKSTLEVFSPSKVPSASEKFILDLFVKDGGASLVKSLFGVSDSLFLNVLSQFALFLAQQYGVYIGVLREMLLKYQLISKETVWAFVALSDETEPLLAHLQSSGTQMNENGPVQARIYADILFEDILKKDVIGEELNFILRIAPDAGSTLSAERIEEARSKFESADVYEKVRGHLSKRKSGHCLVEPIRHCVKQNDENVMKERISELETREKELLEEILKLKTQLKEKEALVEKKPIEKDGGAPSIKFKSGGLFAKTKPVMEAQSPSVPVAQSAPRQSTGGLFSKASGGGLLGKKAAGPGLFGAKKGGLLGSTGSKEEKSKFAANKYTGIKWAKASKTESSIFTGITSAEFEKALSLSDFAEFEIKEEKPKPKKTLVAAPPTPELKAGGLLDVKKSNALNIALGRVRMSDDKLRSAILNHTLDNENVISQFIAYFPTAAEIERIRSSEGPLGRAELLFKNTEDCNALYSALVEMRFTRQFDSKNYREIIRNTKCWYERAMGSSELSRLFGRILAVGNILNVNTSSGGACAFALSSLDGFKTPKIIEVISKGVAKDKLLEELDADEAHVNAEAISQEIKELRKAFVKEHLSTAVREEFEIVLKEFDQMITSFRNAQKYFVAESDSEFLEKIVAFIRLLK